MNPVVVKENRRKKSPNLVLFSDCISKLRLKVIKGALPLLISGICIFHLLSCTLVNESCRHKDRNQGECKKEIYSLCAESWEENFEASVEFFRASCISASVNLVCKSSLVPLTDDLTRTDVVTGTLESTVIIFKIL